MIHIKAQYILSISELANKQTKGEKGRNCGLLQAPLTTRHPKCSVEEGIMSLSMYGRSESFSTNSSLATCLSTPNIYQTLSKKSLILRLPSTSWIGTIHPDLQK